MVPSEAGRPRLRRRDLLGAAPAAAALCVAGAGQAAANTANPNLPRAGDRLVIAGAGSDQGKRVSLDLVPEGGKLLQVLPADGATGEVRDGSRFGKVILVRLAPEDLDEDTRRLSVDGIVAYSAICTHQGCTLNAWKAAERKIACFCHHSEFRADQGGKVAKGPATRRLPQLPLELGPDGEIVVAGGFTARPGPKA